MPDPTAHADDMMYTATLKAKLPEFWWLFPWPLVKQLTAALDDALLMLTTTENSAKDFEQRWLETNESLNKVQGDSDITLEKLKHSRTASEGFKKALTEVMIYREQAERDHAEEHKANVLLNTKVAELEDEIFWLKEKVKGKKKKAKKKAVRRG